MLACGAVPMKTFNVSPQLQTLLEQMSRDMAVPVEGLVNQAVFNWAKLHGYVEPGRPPVEAVPTPPPEPETTRVPVEPEPEPKFEAVVPGGASAPTPDRTAPSLQKQRRIVLLVKGREVTVDSDRFLLGRDVSCDLTIESPRISRQHAIVHVTHDGLELEDLGSSNGTWYAGERITRKKLVHGDEVHIGDTPVRIEFR